VSKDEFIASGILETYALGIASPEEMVEVEEMRALHEEVEASYQEIAASIELAGQTFARPAPKAVREKLFAQITASSLENATTSIPTELPTASHEEPVISSTTPLATLTVEKGDLPIDKIKADKAKQLESGTVDLNSYEITVNLMKTKLFFYRTMAAASIVIALASAAGNIYLYDDLRSTSLALDNTKRLQATIEEDYENTSLKLREMDAQMHIIASPESHKVVLKGMNSQRGMMATVIWMPSDKMVRIMMEKMPNVPLDKDMQLWAIVNGKPVDLGVMDMNTGMMEQAIPSLPLASAFAITIEDKGGHPQPEGEMVMLGNVEG